MRKNIVWITLALLACGSGDSIDFSKLTIPQAPEGKFANPILTSGPDPWVEQSGEWYYVTHTTGTNLLLYKTKRLSELAKAEVKTVWSPPPSGMNAKNIWAPEIHLVNNKWYVYYAADDGDNANHRMWVLENSSADPFQGTWVDKGKVQLPNDKWAIDGTLFERNGQLYFMWSGWEGDINVRQDIYIAKMTNPWTAEGERVLVSKPEHAWEVNGGPPAINEGPQFLVHEGKMFVIYSASVCWVDDYALGMLSADALSDPLNPTSWTKSKEPVFVKNPQGKAFGPGHNGFFKSPDGTEDWIIYHANPSSGQGCNNNRSVRMQKFTWKEDGSPDFGSPLAIGSFVDIPSEK
jgi:GH43 family beta-xylosidase